MDLTRLLVAPAHSLLQVMARINENEQGIALVVDAEGRLLDTVTDGDLRRAVLAGTDLNLPVSRLRLGPHTPITAPLATPRHELARMLREKALRHVPLVDEAGRVRDLVTLADFVDGEASAGGVCAVVMAGGYGMRLRPLTEQVPKPLLPVGDKPVVQRTVEQLRQAGIRQVYLATHYRSQAFTEHFGNGDAFGLHINYMQEENPLGTAGALAHLPPSTTPILVVNGDIVTRLNYRAMLDYHQENHADMTVGVRQYEFSVPYGVVDTEGDQVLAVREKPVQRFFVNAGIYLMQPEVPRYVPRDEHFNMTDLISALIAGGKRVIGFPISEYWLDIGQAAEYEQAQLDVKNGTA